MANSSIFAAFERFWLHITAALGNKADIAHTHTVANISDLTATAAELNYCDGVTSSIQTQLNGKAASSHGTHVSYGTSASALGTSSAGSASTVSRSDHVHALPALTSCTGTLTVAKGGTGATTAAAALTNLGLTATAAELNYCDGVTSSIQTQLNGKAASSHTHTMLSNKYTSRPTTANIASSDDRKGSLEFFTATSSMTTGKPPYDAHILHMNWDNTEGWDAQLAVRGSSTAGLAVRGMNGGTWGDWQEVAMKNHTHTNVGIVTLEGDVLASALSSCASGRLTPVITNSASTNLPSGSYSYSAGYVLRRVTGQATIVLFDCSTGDIATNTYISSAWSGWVKNATQDYVRDAISNIGSSTASGCVSEFDSGVISYAAGSTYYNSKDSKSKFYLVTTKHSGYGSHSWVIDFNYLKTSYQYFRVCVGGTGASTFSPTWITIQVKKDSSNRLVVGVADGCTDVTLTQVCGYY